jgi:nickel-dependent lactate racemase
MIASLRYGAQHALELDLPADRLVACCGAPVERAVRDVSAATTAALESPLAFPPLSRAVVPGDHVVVAFDRDVPRGRDVVAAIIQYLVAHGLNSADITVLTAARQNETESLREALLPEYRGECIIEVHNPDVRDRLSYLAVGRDNEPIYLNRLLCDADVVLPIGCLRAEPTLGYHGMYGGLFPTFSGRETQDKLFARSVANGERGEVRSRERIEEVGWLLGVQFTVQIVPGPAGEVLEVLAGQPGEVFRSGQIACQQAWGFSVPHAAKLVVAAIEGQADEQTWDNMARALDAASRVVAPDGAIALCTTLVEPPGEALRQAAEMPNLRDALRHLRRLRSDDALAAVALCQALGQARLYLLSGLSDAVVEELSITPLANPTELARLARQHPSCILLANAQYVVPTVNGA